MPKYSVITYIFVIKISTSKVVTRTNISYVFFGVLSLAVFSMF